MTVIKRFGKRRYKLSKKDTWIETKIKPRKWRMVYTYYTKKKPSYKIAKVNADQYAIKTTSNKYNLIYKGKKVKLK